LCNINSCFFHGDFDPVTGRSLARHAKALGFGDGQPGTNQAAKKRRNAKKEKTIAMNEIMEPTDIMRETLV
jgi:hypothetical protein